MAIERLPSLRAGLGSSPGGPIYRLLAWAQGWSWTGTSPQETWKLAFCAGSRTKVAGGGVLESMPPRSTTRVSTGAPSGAKSWAVGNPEIVHGSALELASVR